MKYYRVTKPDYMREEATINLVDGKVVMSNERLFRTASFLGVKATPQDGVRFMKLLAIQISNASYERCTLEPSDKAWAPQGLSIKVLREWAKEFTAKKIRKSMERRKQ